MSVPNGSDGMHRRTTSALVNDGAVDGLPIVDDDQGEIVAGRTAPFTMLPEWVALSGITDHAKALYWHLKMHVNIKRGDGVVWPGKEALASWMGLSKGSKIDPYLKELADLGAIEIIRRRYANGMRTRNRYVIHDLPPDGYDGFRSLVDWYRAHGAAVENLETAGQTVVPSTGPRTAAETAPEGKTAGRAVVPSRGVRSPLQGTSVVPSRGAELNEVQLEETSSSSLSSPALPSNTSHAQEEEEGRASGTNNTEAAALVDRAVTEWFGHRAPTADERARLVRRVAQALAAGARPVDVLHTLTRDLDPAQIRTSAVQIVMARTRHDGWAQVAPTIPVPPQPSRPDWCGKCHPDTRMVETEDGRPGRCFDCHPHYVGVA